MTELKLAATHLHARLPYTRDVEPFVVRLTTDPSSPDRSHALLVSAKADRPPGFAAYCLLGGEQMDGDPSTYAMPSGLEYLEEGDIIRLNPRHGEVWVMYRRQSKSNSLLLTERCNSWCVMCSQPPKPKDDTALVRAWFDAIPLMSPETEALGFTGGEPTLLGDLFLGLVAACKQWLPSTSLHILSNGRLFNYLTLASALADLAHADLVVGIPLYSDLAWQHDFIVQAPRAFDQTIRGIVNLARCGVRVEVRVVIHRHSVDRLPHLARFIARNLPFVEHVALMGLEPIGFARSNLAALWVDPFDYQQQLGDAVAHLARHGMTTSVYNHQLCVLPTRIWSYARQSISDWKNVYLPECQNCAVQQRCGGFFHSAIASHSKAIAPLTSDPAL